jgi:hypothetical protein
MSTTSGYDIATQLSERFLGRVLRAVYLNDVLPSRIKRQFNYGSFSGDADLALRAPSLRFETSSSGVKNAVRFKIPFRATVVLRTQPKDAFTTDAEMAFEAEINDQTEYKSGKPVAHYFDVLFNSIPITAFTVTAKAHKYQKYADLMRYLLVYALQNQVVSVALGPKIPVGSAGTGIPYGLKLVVHDDKTNRDADCLAFFIDTQGGASAQQPKVDPFLPDNADYGVAISKEMFDKSIIEAFAKIFPGGFPFRMAQDTSLVLQSLDISLGSGHLEVSGEVTKEIDCWYDATIPFSGKAVPYFFDNGKFNVIAKDIDFDLPWWADVLQVLLPVVGSAIVSTISRAIERALSGAITSQAGALMSDITIFSKDIPVSAASSSNVPVIESQNFWLEIRKDALILSGRMILSRKMDAGLPVIGNVNSRELHRNDAQACVWRHKILPWNQKTFPLGLTQALWEGYNGCWFCMRWYDEDQFREADQ